MRTSLAALLMLAASSNALTNGQSLVQYVQENDPDTYMAAMGLVQTLPEPETSYVSVSQTNTEKVIVGNSIPATEAAETIEYQEVFDVLPELAQEDDPSQNSNDDGITSSDLPDDLMVNADGEIVPKNTVTSSDDGSTEVLNTTGTT